MIPVTVIDTGNCVVVGDRRFTSQPRIVTYEHVFTVKLNDADINTQVITQGCQTFNFGQTIEVLNVGKNIKGEKIWGLRRSGFGWADLLGLTVLILGIGSVFFGFKRVVFGFPKKTPSAQ